MKSDLSTVVLPFPKQLMSTSRSALSMPLEFGREVRNMLMAADGAGAKRNGVVKVGSGIAGETITAVMGFMASGGYQLLVVTDAGKIYRQNGAGWDVVHTGLNVAGVARTVLFGGKLLLCNGLDDVLAYDGVGWSVVSTLVKEAAGGLTFGSATQFSVESDASLYVVGSVVKAVLAGGEVTSTVSTVSVSSDVVTVTLATAVLDATLSGV